MAITAAAAGLCGLAYTTAAAANAAASAASAAAYGSAVAALNASSSAADLAAILQPSDYGLDPGESNFVELGFLCKQQHPTSILLRSRSACMHSFQHSFIQFSIRRNMHPFQHVIEDFRNALK